MGREHSRGKDDGMRGVMGGMEEEEEGKTRAVLLTRLRNRERNDAECLPAVVLESSQSPECRVSGPAALHNGPFPCRRKARTAAELFSSADARAGGKIGGDHKRKRHRKTTHTHTHTHTHTIPSRSSCQGHRTDSLAHSTGFSKTNVRTFL